ncbi:hypothetical protein RFI_23029, partial [Reticulomyxa filosa]
MKENTVKKVHENSKGKEREKRKKFLVNFVLLIFYHKINKKLISSRLFKNYVDHATKNATRSKKKLDEKNDLENELKMLDSTEKPEEAAKEIMKFILNGKEPLLDDDNPYRPPDGFCEKCTMFTCKNLKKCRRITSKKKQIANREMDCPNNCCDCSIFFWFLKKLLIFVLKTLENFFKALVFMLKKIYFQLFAIVSDLQQLQAAR